MRIIQPDNTTASICFAFHWNDIPIFATTDLNEMHKSVFLGNTELCYGRRVMLYGKEYVIDKIRGYTDQGEQNYTLQGVKYPYNFVFICYVIPISLS